jgi:hypothetical protein
MKVFFAAGPAIPGIGGPRVSLAAGKEHHSGNSLM